MRGEIGAGRPCHRSWKWPPALTDLANGADIESNSAAQLVSPPEAAGRGSASRTSFVERIARGETDSPSDTLRVFPSVFLATIFLDLGIRQREPHRPQRDPVSRRSLRKQQRWRRTATNRKPGDEFPVQLRCWLCQRPALDGFLLKDQLGTFHEGPRRARRSMYTLLPLT